MRRQVRQVYKSLALVAVVAAFPKQLWAQHAADSVQVPGKRVDIGGYSLHLACSGAGQPTVVLIHGFNDYSFV